MPATRKQNKPRPSSAKPRSEQHYVDLAFASYNADTTGTITLLNTVAQGVSQSERVGKKWKMSRLELKGQVLNQSTAISNVCKYAIVYDKRPTGVLPAITDIYDSASSFSQMKDDNKGRFTILNESSHSLIGNGTAAANYYTFTKQVNQSLSMQNKLVVNKSAGTGAIGDIEQGALYLVTLGNNVAGTTAAKVQLDIRLRFFDM